MTYDPSAIKVYTVNGSTAGSSSSLPDWLTRKRAAKGKGKRAIRETVEGTIELIQHFDFPEASNRIKTTRDGHHAIATGTYKPRMKVWDLDQLSLKFERYSDAENVDFTILSDDWTKTLHLQNDRTLEVHTQGGFHYRTRIPRFGRALAYHFPSCDAIVGAAGPDVYRLNLEQGRFMTPLNLGAEAVGVNAVDVNPVHQLFGFGLDGEGTVQFWDPRSRSSVGVLRLPKARLTASTSSARQFLPGVDDETSTIGLSITALASRSDGLSYAVGTSTGHTLLYDIRSARAFATKDQGYGLPVKCLSWIDGSSRMAGDGMVVSADSKVIKIWDRNTSTVNFASITPATDINHVHHVPSSGLVFCANEGIQMSAFYLPQLGPAPKWCSFLENITEEMEDQTIRNVYEDYKFIERSELATLGLDHLVGTAALKPYMHGYFVSLKLYDAARVIANPFAYAEHREKLVREKLEKAAESRIRAPKNVPGVKVNKTLAERVRRDEERAQKREEKRRARKAAAMAADAEEDNDEPAAMDVDEREKAVEKPSVLNDPRFSALFENPDFEVDESTREYALTHPSEAAHAKDRAEGSQRRLAKTAVEEEEDESDRASSDGLCDSSDEDDSDAKSDDSSNAGDLGVEVPRQWLPTQRAARAAAEVRMVPIKAQGTSSRGGGTNHQASFGQRRTSEVPDRRRSGGPSHAVRGTTDGGVEISWVPSAGDAARHAAEDAIEDKRAAEAKRGRKAAAAKPEKRKGVESFGAGMERGGQDPARELADSERRGRTERRKGMRSGSKNTIFARR